MKWHEGRQGTGYRVLTLFESKRLKCDVHLIRMPLGSSAPDHLDPAPEGHEHHRVNVVLRDAKTITFVSHRMVFDRVYRFRPDIQPHGVTRVRSWPMWILSFGWLKKVSIPT